VVHLLSGLPPNKATLLREPTDNKNNNNDIIINNVGAVPGAPIGLLDV
jgi:hypothetical protein